MQQANDQDIHTVRSIQDDIVPEHTRMQTFRELRPRAIAQRIATDLFALLSQFENEAAGTRWICAGDVVADQRPRAE
jgi:hypothetical protein